MENSSKAELILFDVYETLLDMSEVRRRVNDLMDSRSGYTLWFELFMQYCFVDNCTIQFNPFDSIARATMQMTGEYFNRKVSDNAITDVLEVMKQLPLQEGVQSGLSGLHDKGYRIAALTNSPGSIVLDRMNRTELISYFEKVLSAEHVQKYKPCIEVYEWAAKSLGISPENVLMVSAHGWDIAGASNAGMRTAYIKLPKSSLYPLTPFSEFICRNLEELNEKLA